MRHHQPSMLYDSDTFVVIHAVGNNEEIDAMIAAGIPRAVISLSVRHIYEIVDKRKNQEVCLHDGMAENFFELTKAWQLEAPHPADVERVLEGYSELAQLPIAIH